MFDTLYSQIGAAISVAVVAFAFLKGDEPERVGAGAYALGLLASLLLQVDAGLSGPRGAAAGAVFSVPVRVLERNEIPHGFHETKSTVRL